MTVPARVSIVTLGVADVARATAFYESLGWVRSSASQPAISFFHMAGTVLALFGRADLALDAGVAADGSGFAGVTVAVNCDDRAAVDAAVAAWVDAGGSVVKRPEVAPWGGYSGYVADLDGHLWELAHNPFFPVGDDGIARLPD